MEKFENKENTDISQEELLETFIRHNATPATFESGKGSIGFTDPDSGKSFHTSTGNFFVKMKEKQWFREDDAIYFKSEAGIGYWSVTNADKIEMALKKLNWEEVKDYNKIIASYLTPIN